MHDLVLSDKYEELDRVINDDAMKSPSFICDQNLWLILLLGIQLCLKAMHGLPIFTLISLHRDLL